MRALRTLRLLARATALVAYGRSKLHLGKQECPALHRQVRATPAMRLLAAGPPAGVPQPTANDSLTPPNPLPACAPNLPPRHHHGKFDRDDDPDYGPSRN